MPRHDRAKGSHRQHGVPKRAPPAAHGTFVVVCAQMLAHQRGAGNGKAKSNHEAHHHQVAAHAHGCECLGAVVVADEHEEDEKAGLEHQHLQACQHHDTPERERHAAGDGGAGHAHGREAVVAEHEEVQQRDVDDVYAGTDPKWRPRIAGGA